MTYKTYIEIEVEVEFDATPYRPAQTYGPPEACYPEEGGEVEITGVTYCDKPISLSEKDMEVIQKDVEQKLADGEFDSEPDYDTWD